VPLRALGHPDNAPCAATFKWFKDHPELLRSILHAPGEGDVNSLLDMLDPRPNNSMINTGNLVAYGFSSGDTKDGVCEQPYEWLSTYSLKDVMRA
jgi:hypothetical protein